MTAVLRALFGLIGNPATHTLSHSKLWANIAAGVMTYQFLATPNPSMELWLAYGSMVGGYALLRRGIAAAQVVGERGEARHD
ncbi:hypothetical protein [Stenoxybacter acetivorans]|uniref:hypothetical protein n=1 Tax=Stenoxybacter acetivorans TaxID=422441 RepID=UPI000559C957|nr:hypothetical protein [Stenoxybacter acetivorans]